MVMGVVMMVMVGTISDKLRSNPAMSMNRMRLDEGVNSIIRPRSRRLRGLWAERL
jgi:hypothetical protein